MISGIMHSQSYLGTTTKKVNFREGSSTDDSIISSLKPNTQIFIISLETENEYYNVINIEADKEGYVHKSFVKLGKVVNKSDGSFIAASGNSSGNDSEAKIFNNTSITMTLKLNEVVYQFSPKETKNIVLSPGNYEFRASAPGVLPNIGIKNFENNRAYKWQFYISSSRR
jgi:uncharacterized protein YgiM (DUF1202 family)